MVQIEAREGRHEGGLGWKSKNSVWTRDCQSFISHSLPFRVAFALHENVCVTVMVHQGVGNWRITFFKILKLSGIDAF